MIDDTIEWGFAYVLDDSGRPQYLSTQSEQNRQNYVYVRVYGPDHRVSATRTALPSFSGQFCSVHEAAAAMYTGFWTGDIPPETVFWWRNMPAKRPTKFWVRVRPEPKIDSSLTFVTAVTKHSQPANQPIN